ncbi:MAG: hypothetical protein H0Z24_06660 [Thermosipho sp. (in: Bacteria)]|nr:hypothetical protein [Thermosipho sp. (in: thermotogales)]
MVEIRLGALSKPIKEQLESQGYYIEKVDYFQKIAKSISHLYIAGYITDSVKEKAYRKLCSEIAKKIKPLEKVEGVERERY